MPRRTVSREMKKMQDGGIIGREGARKNGSWIVKQPLRKDLRLQMRLAGRGLSPAYEKGLALGMRGKPADKPKII
jgi:hypothetical protein